MSAVKAFGYYDPRSGADFLHSFAGVKGPHPRMAYCCQSGSNIAHDALDRDIALAEDYCSQYCLFAGSLDLWLYCLTMEGDTVANAFFSSDGTLVATSGSQLRDGPFNPKDEEILYYKKNRRLFSAGSAVVPKGMVMLVAVGMVLVAMLGL